MSRRVQRVKYHLDPKKVKNLPSVEIKAILRGADDLIGRGGGKKEKDSRDIL